MSHDTIWRNNITEIKLSRAIFTFFEILASKRVTREGRKLYRANLTQTFVITNLLLGLVPSK